MQEIFVDSNSLDELTMVIEDILSKRKTVCINDGLFSASNLIIKIRLCAKGLDKSDPNQKEMFVIDLSELNEPISEISKMFHVLENNPSSLSLDTLICQQIFEKLRKANIFRVMTFLKHKPKASADQSEYTRRLMEFIDSL
jgi:hypothetical protein